MVISTSTSASDPAPNMHPLERLRLDRGYTQVDLERAAGVSNKTVGKIESGATREPHAPTLARLANVLEVAPSALMAAIRQHNLAAVAEPDTPEAQFVADAARAAA